MTIDTKALDNADAAFERSWYAPLLGSLARLVQAAKAADRLAELEAEIERLHQTVESYASDAAMAAISQPAEPEFPPASAVVDDRCGECGEFETECECLPTVEPELIADHGLIECPHCGKSPIVTLHPAHKHTGPLADFMPEVGDTYTAECCGGMIDDSLDDLREKWNRRATARAGRRAAADGMTLLSAVSTTCGHACSSTSARVIWSTSATTP